MENKKFDEVEIGDEAFDCNVGDHAGFILAKGSFKELDDNGYESCAGYEEMLCEGYCDEEDLAECVAISQNPADTLEGFTSFIFLYDFDTSSVVCYK